MAAKAPEPFILPGKEGSFAKALGKGTGNSYIDDASLLPATQTNTDDTARLYTHLHPVLVLSVFAARFSATVADPVSSLLTLLPITAALQCAYCVLCVPASSSSTATATSSSANETPAKRKTGRKPAASTVSSASPATKIFPAILSLLLALLVGTPVLTAFLILHGAPLTTHLAHTTLTGAHFSLLAALPLFFAHGVDATHWRALAGLGAAVDELSGAAIGCCVGAWLGAIPIPLDWDRPWQAWPVTIVTGMYGGWAVGRLVGGTVGFGRNISFRD